NILVPPGGAVRLGAIAPGGETILFASKSVSPAGATQPSTDVKAIGSDGGTAMVLVPGTTSCPSCLYDSFTRDGRSALVIDPIDNGQNAGGTGPVRIVDLATGASIATVGAHVITAGAVGDARLAFVEAVPATGLSTGFAYGVSTRGIGATDALSVVAAGAENV